MIRFICPELERKSPSQMILTELMIHKTSSVENWSDLNGTYVKHNRYLKGPDDINNYINTLALYTQNSFNVDKMYKTIANFATFTGLSITNYTGLSSETIQFNVRTVDDITSGYFYTIFTETGIIFTKPVRQSASVDRGVVTEFISKTEKSDPVLKYFENPTTIGYLADPAKWIIGADINTITPAIINSTWKQLANNKAKSKTKTITFVSGVEMNALDYIRHNLDIYIVMSRVTMEKNLYQYTAVLESNETWAINGQDYYYPGQTGIIESGSNANGTYIKYADGTMIAWIIKTASVAITNSWGAIYWGWMGQFSYPATFISAPSETATVSDNNPAGSAAVGFLAELNNTTTTSKKYMLWRPGSTSAITYTISIQAIGRWRA